MNIDILTKKQMRVEIEKQIDKKINHLYKIMDSINSDVQRLREEVKIYKGEFK